MTMRSWRASSTVSRPSYMAARTSRIKLATGAVILPWHNPLRVAEKVALLDHLSGGRAFFGMGRGLSRREYEPFGLDMDTSRDRFDEASRMILDALETGFIEGDGPYYPQPRTAIRPRPRQTFKGRVSSVAMSPDSVQQAARLGIKMVVFTQKAWEEQREIFEGYGREFRRHHDEEPPPPLICDYTYCHADPAVAEARAREYITGYMSSLLHHYELASDSLQRHQRLRGIRLQRRSHPTPGPRENGPGLSRRAGLGDARADTRATRDASAGRRRL